MKLEKIFSGSIGLLLIVVFLISNSWAGGDSVKAKDVSFDLLRLDIKEKRPRVQTPYGVAAFCKIKGATPEEIEGIRDEISAEVTFSGWHGEFPFTEIVKFHKIIPHRCEFSKDPPCGDDIVLLVIGLKTSSQWVNQPMKVKVRILWDGRKTDPKEIVYYVDP